MIDTLILGPCQHENIKHATFMYEKIKLAAESSCKEFYYKSSFDKANRTSGNTMRGKGLDVTLSELRELKETYPECKILTDIHDVNQVETIRDKYFDVVDVLQVPAFLSRQTDLIQSCCENGFIVNIKKGQFMAPWDVKGILSKTQDASKEVWITERGTSFGYNTLVNDFTGMQYIMDNYDCKFVYDVTHSVQKPGGLGTSSGGNREYIPRLAYAAAAMGVNNFFLETHDNPDNAPSDGPNMIPIEKLSDVLYKLRVITDMSNMGMKNSD